MKINKKFLIIGSISVLSLSLWSFVGAKKSQAQEIFKQIQFRLHSIKRIRIADSKLKFDIDILLQNPTAHDFTLSSSGLIKAKVFRVFKAQNLLGVAMLNNIDSVSLMAGSTHIFRDITVEIPLVDLGKELGNIVLGNNLLQGIQNLINQGNIGEHLKNINWKQVLEQMRYEIDIEAFGSIYTFRQ